MWPDTASERREGEMKKRIELATKIRQLCHIPPWGTSPILKRAAFWSMLMVMDISHLQNMLRELESTPPEEIRRASNEMSAVAESMLRKVRLGSEVMEEIESTRDQTERQKAFVRDNGICVFTGTRNPDVCHIIPFFPRNVDRAQVAAGYLIGMCSVWGSERCMRIFTKYLKNDGEAIDRASNMLCMSRQLHECLAQGRLALEPVEGPPSDKPTIWIKARWLEKTWIPSMMEEVSFSMDPREQVIDSVAQSRPIRDGHVVKVTADTEDGLPDRDFLYFVSVIAKAHAMTGAPNPEMYPWDLFGIMKIIWEQEDAEDEKGKSPVKA
ncbi:hypothetical protein C8034_v001409 [Colletotrichum sidae]|uniref:HNH nuclease domain-containing protein n=1 Tax=Colletotrichum sidae TaxID=1347389 RepID=A0A4R8TDU5_9PEZI|nr:hypothetical protein C8034_v001409 [Colletotrichum sidae]